MSNKTDLQRNNVILGDTPNGLIGGVSRIESALEKKNVSVEKTGTYATFSELETAINNKVTDTYDADATANDIAIGKTAYAKGKKLTGNAQLVGKSDFSFVKDPLTTAYNSVLFISSDNLLFEYSNNNSEDMADRTIYLFNDNSQQYDAILDMSDYPTLNTRFKYNYMYEDNKGNIFASLGVEIDTSISGYNSYDLIKKFNRNTRKFETVLSITNTYQGTFSENCRPIFVEINNKTFVSFNDSNFQGFYYFNEDTQAFEKIDNFTQSSFNYNLIAYNNEYFGSYYYGLFKINIDTLEITELRKSTGTLQYKINNLIIRNNHLFNLDSNGVEVYDANTQNFEAIYNGSMTPSYYYPGFGSGDIYVFNNNYIYYDTGPNLQGALLLDLVNKTYKQVIPLDESTSQYPIAQWSGFIERNGELFCYSKRQYSPNSWINKWNDTEKVFERVSDIIGYNYYVYVFENDIYIRCQNPTSDQTDKKFNIYKYNDTTKYFDTLVATTTSSGYFYMVRLTENKVFMTTNESSVYVMNADGVFDTKFSYSGLQSNYQPYSRILDSENNIYIVYQYYDYSTVLFYDVINNAIINVGTNLRGMRDYTDIFELDNNIIFLNCKDSSYKTYLYNKQTKKINDAPIVATVSQSSSFCKFVYKDNTIYSSHMYTFKWSSKENKFKLSNESTLDGAFKLKNTYLCIISESANILHQVVNGVDIPLCLNSVNYSMLGYKKLGNYIILSGLYKFDIDNNKNEFYQLIGTEDTSNES